MLRVAYFAKNTGRVDGARLTAGYVMDQTGGNTGNLAFFRAARELFDDDILLVGNQMPVADYAASVDRLVISAANFLNPDWDFRFLGNAIEALGKECLVFGLGAQAQSEAEIPRLKDGTVFFLRAAAAHCRTIFVRGDFSAKVCEHYGVKNVEPVGCPSMTLNGDRRLGEQIAAKIGQPLARLYSAGAAFKGELKALERALFDLVRSHPGSLYCVQGPEPILALADGTLAPGPDIPAIVARAHDFLAPGTDIATFFAQFAEVSRYFSDLTAWQQSVATCDYGVCTRIHGAIMTLMAGVPTVVAGHDTRIRELCSTMLIPQRSAAEITQNATDLPTYFESLKFDGPAFDRRRRAIAATYVAYLRHSGLTPSRRLAGLAGEAS